jgi:hypothetical protein
LRQPDVEILLAEVGEDLASLPKAMQDLWREVVS